MRRTHYGFSSVDHHQRRGRIPHKGPLFDLRDRDCRLLLIRLHGLQLENVVMPELLPDLPQGDAQTERGDDVECAEVQSTPGERRDWLEDQPVDLDDREKQERHCQRETTATMTSKRLVIDGVYDAQRRERTNYERGTTGS